MTNKYLITLTIEILGKVPKCFLQFITDVDVSFECQTIEITINGAQACDGIMSRLEEELTITQFNKIIFSEV